MAERRRRDLTAIPQTAEDPSVNLTTRSNPVPQTAMVQAPDTGLGTLSRAFDGFFGRVSQAAQTLLAAENMDREVEIAKAVEDRATAGTADAAAGKPMAEGQDQFRSYYNAYSKVAGDRIGFDMADEFSRVMATLPPDASPEEARDAFLKQQADAGRFTGENQVHAAAALSRFGSLFEGMRRERTQASIRQVQADTTEAWGSNLQARVRAGDDIDFNQEVGRYRDVKPLDAANAPLRVAAQIIAGAGNDPASIQRVMALLRRPGSGNEGRSFAETFPANYDEIEKAADAKLNGIHTLEAREAWGNIATRMAAASTPEDFTALGRDVETTFSRLGGGAAWRQARINLANGLQKFSEQTAKVNANSSLYSRAMVDRASVNATDVDLGKAQADFLAVRGIDPFDRTGQTNHMGELMGPPGTLQAAQAVAQTAVINPALRDSMTYALLDASNPDRQQTAFEFYSAISARGLTGAQVKTLMGTEAHDFYEALQARLQGNSGSIRSTIDAMNTYARENPNQPPQTWRTLTGESKEADAITKVDAEIASRVRATIGDDQRGVAGTGLFSEASVNVPPNIAQAIRSQALARADGMARFGKVDWKAAVKAATEGVMGRASLIPGADGSRVLQLAPVDPPAGSVRLGRGIVNPATGRPEDTTATAEKDLGELATAIPSRFQQGRTGLSLDGTNPMFAQKGLFEVVEGGVRVMFRPGQVVEVTPRSEPSPGLDPLSGSIIRGEATPAVTMTVPSDPAEMAREFTRLFPGARVDFVPVSLGAAGIGYQMVYRPRFAATAGPSAADRERDFQAPGDPNAGAPRGDRQAGGAIFPPAFTRPGGVLTEFEELGPRPRP
jgi:hypothetical protein